MVLHNYFSPDGFTISFEWFTSKQDADLFLRDWIKGFTIQGYYCTKDRIKISPYDIESQCTYVEKEFIEDEEDNITLEPFQNFI